MIKLTDREKEIINRLNDRFYTVEFIEKWINRNDNAAVNAPAALQAMGVSGYYSAVQRIAELEGME